jgi:hypothetical protein
MSVLAVLKAADANPSAEVADAEQSLTKYVDAVSQVMGESHAVVHTVLIPIESKNLTFDVVSANFDRLKAEAQTWTDVTGPSMTQVPQAIISFADSFDGQYDTIAQLLDQIGDRPPTTQQKSDLTELLKYLGDVLNEQQRIIDSDKDKITNYQRRLAADHASLIDGTRSITELIKEDRATVMKLNADIQKLRQDIENIRTAVFNPGFLKVGLRLIVAFLTLELESVGEFNQARRLVFSLGGLGHSISNVTDADHVIAEDQDRIQQDQRKISIENRQIVMLNAIADTINKLVEVTAKASDAIQTVSDRWRDVASEVESAITRLSTAEGSIVEILNRSSLENRHQSWMSLKEFARKMQFSLSNITIEPPVQIPTGTT